MWKRTSDTTSFSLYVNSKSNKSCDVKFRIVISINPDPPPLRLPHQIKVLLLPKFTPTLVRGDRNCVTILATLLKCNIRWRKQLIVFINKEINVILQVNFFWSSSHNSWSFIVQRFISSIASFLTIYRISRFLTFFVWQGVL